MTTDREVMQMALDAMVSFSTGTNGLYEGEFAEEIAALRTALSQPEQEPVSWMYDFYSPDDPTEIIRNWTAYSMDEVKRCGGVNVRPLYLAPPQRPWQGLTDEEIRNEAKNHVFDESFFSGAIWARGKMMGKNYD